MVWALSSSFSVPFRQARARSLDQANGRASLYARVTDKAYTEERLSKMSAGGQGRRALAADARAAVLRRRSPRARCDQAIPPDRIVL